MEMIPARAWYPKNLLKLLLGDNLQSEIYENPGLRNPGFS